LTLEIPVSRIISMITTVTRKNMVTVPAQIAQKYGIQPGYRLEWTALDGEQISVRVIPDRRELSRRLLGKGRNLAPEREAVAELVEERACEG
jgi:AbrB family looped-hinge helix DNA binding protein